MSALTMESRSVNAKNLKAAAQDLDFALALIEQLKGGSIARAPVEKISEIVEALIQGVPYLLYPMPGSYELYRGRVNNSERLLKYAKDFSYRPKEGSKLYGRCHQPGETMYYGSTSMETVFSELLPEIGDKVHVGVSSAQSESPLMVTAIGEIDHSRRFKTPLLGGDVAYKALNDALLKIKNDHGGKHARALIVDAFFSDIFAQTASKQRDYKFTSCISNSLFQTKSESNEVELEGFAYPSVAHRGGLNFAVAPSAFDSKFKWDRFMALEIKNYFGFGIYSWEIYAEADTVDESGALNWREL